MSDVAEKTETVEILTPPTQPQLPADQSRPAPMRLSTQMLRKSSGGSILAPKDMGEALEVAKLMSKAEGAVGPHLLGNPGGCLKIVLQAMEWGMSPFAVAQHSYTATKVKPGEPIGAIAYEAQLYMAVANKLASIKEHGLQHRFEGDGDNLVCIVWATFKGESHARELRSETLAQLRPGKNQYGDIKGSPLWTKKPRQQMVYNTTRDWVRLHCPELMLGVYTHDELLDYAEEETPAPKQIVDPFAGPGPRVPANGGGQQDGHWRDEPHGSIAISQPAATVPDADTSSRQSSANLGEVEPDKAPSPAPSIQESGAPPSPESDESADRSSDTAGTPPDTGAPATFKTAEDAARWAGDRARKDGKEEEFNPYEQNSSEWVAWIAGYYGEAK